MDVTVSFRLEERPRRDCSAAVSGLPPQILPVCGFQWIWFSREPVSRPSDNDEGSAFKYLPATLSRQQHTYLECNDTHQAQKSTHSQVIPEQILRRAEIQWMYQASPTYAGDAFALRAIPTRFPDRQLSSLRLLLPYPFSNYQKGRAPTSYQIQQA